MEGFLVLLLGGIRDLLSAIGRVLDHVPLLRAALGTFLTLVLPGLAWTLVLFNGKRLSIVERLVLSAGISISAVTLSIFVANQLFRMRITGLNAVLVILALTLVPVLWFLGLRLHSRRVRGCG